MILDKLQALYEARAQRRRTGHATGSRFGDCAAALQFQASGIVESKPYPVRALMMFEAGHMMEEWWAKAIEEAFPGLHGLAEEPFYFKVPLDEKDTARVAERITREKFWGRIWPEWIPPSIQLGPDGRVKIRLSPRDQDGKPARLGFVLDPTRKLLWAPAQVDRIILHPELNRLVVLEKKTVSNFSMRRAILGEFDYRYRCQLAGTLEATGLDGTFLILRKETHHLVEVTYTKAVSATQIRIRKLNGQVESFIDNLAAAQTVKETASWEVASVWNPWASDALLDEIRDRIRRVTAFEKYDTLEALSAAVYREYGPSFVCEKCGGAGRRICVFCNGTRVSKRSKTGKTCRPCADSVGIPSTVACDSCEEHGMVEETELPFMCSYAVSSDTPVLTLNLGWVRADAIRQGMHLLTVSEHQESLTGHRASIRRTVDTVVEATHARSAEAFTIQTTSGDVVASKEHPWLARPPHGDSTSWVETLKLGIGWHIAFVVHPSESPNQESDGYKRGYLKGVFDGDGTINPRPGHPSARLAMSDPESLDRFAEYCSWFGLRTLRSPFLSFSKRPMEMVWLAGVNDINEFLILTAEEPQTQDESAGYLAGIFDAEGSFSRRGAGTWLRISQRPGTVLDRTQAAAMMLKLPMVLEPQYKGSAVRNLRLSSRTLSFDAIRFFAVTRPAITRKIKLVSMGARNRWATVTGIYGVGVKDMIDLQTSSKTFIAAGFVSHNCPVVTSACYPFIGEPILDTRPHYKVTRTMWEASGRRFVTPKGATR